MSDLDDCALVALTLTGRDVAFEALMRRHAPVVLGFLRGRLSNDGDAEDLAQEVFLKAFRSLEGLKSRERLGRWLLRIARNQLIDHYRTQSRRPKIIAIQTDEDGKPIDPLANAPAPGPSPSEGLALAQSRNAVLEAISRMNELDQQILYWRLVDSQSTNEIARRLGKKPVTVRSRLCRGMKKLRKRLEKEGIRP